MANELEEFYGDVARLISDGNESHQTSGADADDGEVVRTFVDGKEEVFAGIEAQLAGLLPRGNRPAKPAYADVHGHDASRRSVGNVKDARIRGENAARGGRAED